MVEILKFIAVDNPFIGIVVEMDRSGPVPTVIFFFLNCDLHSHECLCENECRGLRRKHNAGKGERRSPLQVGTKIFVPYIRIFKLRL